MAVAVKTEKSNTLSFPRRFFMALCVAGIAVIAFYLFYHEPTLKKIDDIEQSMSQQREAVAKANLERKNLSRQISMLTNDNEKLEKQIEILHTLTDAGEIDVKHSISNAINRCGDLALSFDTGPDPATNETKSSKDNKASFSIQGSFQDMMAFLESIPRLKGIPHDWALEFWDQEDYLDLWMEMEFTK